jgi:hypothetical protein
VNSVNLLAKLLAVLSFLMLEIDRPELLKMLRGARALVRVEAHPDGNYSVVYVDFRIQHYPNIPVGRHRSSFTAVKMAASYDHVFGREFLAEDLAEAFALLKSGAKGQGIV